MIKFDFSPLANAPDPGAALEAGMQQGRAIRMQREGDNALATLAQNPNDVGAQNALMAVRPELGMRYRQQTFQREQAVAGQQADQQQAMLKTVGNAAKMATTPEQWDATVDALVVQGMTGAARYKGQFSPATRAAVMAQAGVSDDDDRPSAMEQNYNFLNRVDPAAAKGYVSRQGEPAPMIARNEDGTFTVVPRGQMGQQAAPAAGAPQPGAVEDGHTFKGGDPADPSNWEVVGGAGPQGPATFPG